MLSAAARHRIGGYDELSKAVSTGIAHKFAGTVTAISSAPASAWGGVLSRASRPVEFSDTHGLRIPYLQIWISCCAL